MRKDDRLKELVEIIKDLADRDEAHLLLEPYEIAGIRILKTTANLSYNMLSPDSKDEDDAIMIEYSNIQPLLIQLYVDTVLVVNYVGVSDFTSLSLSSKTIPVKNSFGLKLVVLLQNTVGALLEGLEKESPVLFGAALKLLHAFIMSILEMYDVPKENFYDDVEEFVYFSLAESSKEYIERSTNKLKTEFKGKNPITLSVKVDRRKRNPFAGFRVTVGDNDTILFTGPSPYKAFLSAAQYINEHTEFKDVKFHMDSKTRTFLNKYSIMYAKEDQLVSEMVDGFYPVLVPKGVTDMEGFLEALIKK